MEPSPNLQLASEPLSEDVLVFDIETNGLLPELHTLHCIAVAPASAKDPEEVRLYHDDPEITPCAGSTQEGVDYLQAHAAKGGKLAGHNIIGYDAPALEKLCGVRFSPEDLYDTTVWSRLIYSDRRERDFRLHEQGRIEGRYIGQHSLASWGNRLGEPKGDPGGDWSTFTQSMADYCRQDVVVNCKLYRVLASRLPENHHWESLFADFCERLGRTGVQLDRKVATDLLRTLEDRKMVLEEEIAAEFPPMYVRHKPYPNGKPRLVMCKHRGEKHADKMIPFNPGSRQQLARRLESMYSWVPKELTAKGNPALHEAALMDIARVYPVAAKVAEYHIVKSRIGVLSDGDQAYFKLCDENDVLHGRTISTGTVTGRCAHRSPNTGNICSIRKPYGKEMRSIFIPFKGYRQAGFDADGLELRMLANRLAPYDGGAYANAVHSGKKEEGTDVHTLHAQAISEIFEVDRDAGKSVTYAFLYGAGNKMLGRLVEGGAKKGAAVRRALIKKIDGMELLQDKLAADFKRGHVESLLGMRVGIRHEHAVLNSQLQSDGAAVMKLVPVLLEKFLEESGVRVGTDYIATGHIHDEVQGSLRPGLEDTFSSCVERAFNETQRLLEIQVPLVGSADFGSSWAQTH